LSGAKHRWLWCGAARFVAGKLRLGKEVTQNAEFHWEPAAREDLTWHQWIYWTAHVLITECYRDRHVRIGGVAAQLWHSAFIGNLQ
jgi:hypothetical protein